MGTHTGYAIQINHPLTEELVDADVSFYYQHGSIGSSDEPPSDAELELSSCVVDGEDLLDQMSTWQIHNIEGEIMDGVFGDDDFDSSYDDEYDEEWSYNVA